MIKISLLTAMTVFLLTGIPAMAATFTDETVDACIKYGEEYGIDSDILLAVIQTESGGEPSTDSGVHKGLMQINHTLVRDRMERIGAVDLMEVYDNVHTGTDIIAEMNAKYKDMHKALMCYNMGECGAIQYFKAGIGTSNYSRLVLYRAAVLKAEKAERRKNELQAHERTEGTASQDS